MAHLIAGSALPIYSAKDSAITQRPVSSSLLCIDSEDRYGTVSNSRTSLSRSSPYDFTITKTENIMSGFFTRVAVSDINFPWGIPNINVKTNRMNVAWDGGAPVEITLTPGFYTPAALAAAVQVAVRALGGGVPLAAFTIVYGLDNIPRFSYATNNPARSIAFTPITTNSASYNYDLTYTRQLFDLMGLDDTNGFFSTTAVSGTTYCQAIRYVDIVSPQLTYNQALKDTMSQPVARDVLCRVYLGEPAGAQSTVPPSSATFCPPGCAPFTIYRQFATPKYIQWMPNQPVGGAVQFRVFDDQGQILTPSLDVGGVFYDPLRSRLDWSMTLLVSEN
ncbi:hypothetical protein EBZ39_08430 [bacterium]|nr:hypothetical protein [bacterium]